MARLCGLKSAHTLPNVSLIQAVSVNLHEAHESKQGPRAPTVTFTDVRPSECSGRAGQTVWVEFWSHLAKRQPRSSWVRQSPWKLLRASKGPRAPTVTFTDVCPSKCSGRGGQTVWAEIWSHLAKRQPRSSWVRQSPLKLMRASKAQGLPP